MRVYRRQQFAAALMTCGIMLAGAAGSTFADTGYYKWTDQLGELRYSDRPPPAGVAYEFVSSGSGLSRNITAEESLGESPEPATAASMPRAEKKKPNLAEQQAAVEKNPAYCDQARANLDTLNSSARVRLRNPDGEIIYLSEEDKDIQRKKAQDLIDVHCN